MLNHTPPSEARNLRPFPTPPKPPAARAHVQPAPRQLPKLVQPPLPLLPPPPQPPPKLGKPPRTKHNQSVCLRNSSRPNTQSSLKTNPPAPPPPITLPWPSPNVFAKTWTKLKRR